MDRHSLGPLVGVKRVASGGSGLEHPERSDAHDYARAELAQCVEAKALRPIRTEMQAQLEALRLRMSA